MPGLRGFLEDYAAAVYREAAGFLEARRRLLATVEGRDLSELVDLGPAAEMLLGGFQASIHREQRYPPRSLARFYRDVVGVYVAQPERLAARLRDGLPLRLAGWGIRVASSKTKPLAAIEAVADAARALLESLGATPPEPGQLDTGDPMWAPEALHRLLTALIRGMPPYSREALVLYSASATVTGALLESLGAGGLEDLGLEEHAELPGPQGDPRRRLLRARESSPLHRYRCLVYAGARLLGLRELEPFYTLPSPISDLVDAALQSLEACPAERRELLQVLAGRAARRLNCLPRLGCPVEPPCLPAGLHWLEATAALDGDVLRLDGLEAGVGETMDALAPLMAHGLALVEVEEADGEKRLRLGLLQPQRPLPR
ncbi:hypothetical protein CF15_06875 [Pyrodictium occultum]|uniref:Uncharacterized protein n=1 Tax=Pyrodictium occultum TaxID=2309 RepID=A0A0V8RWI6_PYROC|nr:hypothetical protein [Pyrodictium occultum]KSW12441.1 hypothetical protein CF15_06875 [Pyrodictium occultum]